MIAALTIPDVPTGSVEIREWDAAGGSPVSFAAIRLNGADGKGRLATLFFSRQSDGCRLMVTREVVARYVRQLKGEPGTTEK